MRYVFTIGIALALAGCSSEAIRTVDASHGQPSKAYTVRVDGSMFLGATPAALYVDSQVAAIIKRGETANVMLPCGKQVLGVMPPGAGDHSFKMQTLEIDPCDGGMLNIHVSFEAFRGFFLTREA